MYSLPNVLKYKLLFLVIIGFSLPLKAQLQTAKIFSDHMVLQREEPLKIWGWATPDKSVHLNFNDNSYHGVSDPDGYWEISVPAQQAGGPYSLEITSEKEKISISDVMIGDVWLCSGQSNMEWTVENSNQSETEIKNGNYPHIRHFKVPRSSSSFPEAKLAGGAWEVTLTETVGDFTAVGYFFARFVHKSEGVPIGLLNSSWGGSRIEPWIRAEDLGYEDPKEMAAQLEAKRSAEKAEFMKMLKSKLGEIPEKDLGISGDQAVWAAKDLQDSDWKTMDLPALWEQNGWEKTDGVFWFRKTVSLGKGRQIADATLSLGPIDDSDQTWVNGHKVGEMEQAYNKNRVYRVPSKYLKEGTNIITVRVDDTGGGGGIYGDPKLLNLKVGEEEISLAGSWKYKVGMVRLNNGAQSANQQPTLLYNKMIHPVLKFPIKGVLWYQGESNAGNQKDASDYAGLFKTLISSWRALWAQGDFPFLYVQLANFMAPKGPSEASNWALLRESQTGAMELPNTAQAVIIDIGEENDIHPRNKQDVGYRLGLAAQKLAYGRNVIPSGPVFREMQVDQGKLILKFNYADSGLKTKDGSAPGGFAIAGADKKFVWATARIRGSAIEVSAEEIKEPVAVRYAWGDNPDKANLYNKEGLPASPFRTDQWD